MRFIFQITTIRKVTTNNILYSLSALLLLLTVLSFINYNCSAQTSISEWCRTESSFDSLFNYADKKFVTNGKVSEKLVEQLHQIAVSKNNNLMLSKYYYLRSNLLSLRGNHNEAYETIKSAAMLLDTLACPYDYARYEYQLAFVFQEWGMYPNSFAKFHQALQKFEKLGKTEYVGKACNQLGLLLLNIDERDLALEYLQRSKNIFEQLGLKRNVTLVTLNISSVIAELGEHQEAIRQLKGIIPFMKEFHDTAGLVKTLNNIGLYYSQVHLQQEAGKYYDWAKSLALKYHDDELAALVNLNYGSYYLSQNSYKPAKNCYNQALNYARTKNNIKYHILSNLGLSNVYAATKEWDSAYIYLLSYNVIKDSIQGIDKAAEIQKIQARKSIADLNQKLEYEQQKNEIKRKQLIIITLSGSLFLLVLVSVIIIIQQQKRNLKQKEHIQEIANRQLKERMAKDEVIQQLKEENYRHEINSKNRELSTSALMLTRKSEVLGKIQDLSDLFYRKQEISKGFHTALKKMVSDNIRLEEDWSDFKLHFEKVHQDFFHKLRNHSNALTENDLRLCAYVRIGMRIKQIAQMLSVSPDSIKTNRYRLRKKFGIPEGFSLDEFISGI